jgi:AraC-like DNA-binding protein
MLDGPPEDYRLMRFSTAQVGSRDRVDAWRHILSRKLLHVSVDSLSDTEAFRAETQLRVFDGLRYGSGLFDASINRRDRRAVAADNDDLMIIVNLDDRLLLRQMEDEVTLGAGDASVLSCAEPGIYQRREAGRIRAIRVPRAALVRSVADVETRLGHVIPHDTPLLNLLTGYLDAIDRSDSYANRTTRELVVSHVHDILGLMLGAAGDAAHAAVGRGLKAARLRALKDDIVRNLERRDLSAASLAIRHNMSMRSVQRAFEQQGTTFTAYLLDLRLKAMHQRLCDPRNAGCAISDLALDCGFGDMSHFNHNFRRRFGTSPSEMRLRAR